MDELDRGLRDAAFCLDVRVAVLADLQHVEILTAHNGTAVRAFELALLLESAEVFSNAVFRDLEHLGKILDAHLAVTR